MRDERDAFGRFEGSLISQDPGLGAILAEKELTFIHPIMKNQQECIDVCNSLLRGELSAVETYEQALEKFEGQGHSEILAALQSDHRSNAEILRSHLLDMGAEPADSSGAWGGFAQAVEGSAKLFGES